jgi:two-component system, NarL family, sensor histidine kinase UhpB
MRRSRSQPRRAPRELDSLTAAFAARGIFETQHGKAALRAAQDRAAIAHDALAGEQSSAELIRAPFAGALLVELLAEADHSPEELRSLAGELTAGDEAVGALSLLREALRAPALQDLDPAEGRRIALSALFACAPLRHASIWSRDALGRVVCSASLGQGATSPAATRLARTTIAAEAQAETPAGELRSVAISRAGQPVAALVARTRRGAGRAARAFMAEAQAPLASLLERESLLASNSASERMLLQASERRLTRLGYDLHDGPLQELLLVGEDLALFRSQLAVVLEGRRGKELLGGRLDDLDARLLALERGVRGISSSVHSDVLVTRPFREALRDLFDPFTARSGIQPALHCEGDLESISTSQRLAVLSVVGEALNNVREHGQATAVSVSIELRRDGLTARVRDDGRGFDVERELLRAARSGHMGLAGMHERVRLLDGHCRVDSRPGGPTEVTLALPRWRGPAARIAAPSGAKAARS